MVKYLGPASSLEQADGSFVRVPVDGSGVSVDIAEDAQQAMEAHGHHFDPALSNRPAPTPEAVNASVSATTGEADLKAAVTATESAADAEAKAEARRQRAASRSDGA